MVVGRYAELVNRFREWAENEPTVRAALIVGSQARTTEPADEWSDLDVVVFHEAPERLLGDTDWFHQLGDPVLSFVEPTAVLDYRERRVLYSGSRDVDFAVLPSAALALIAQSPQGLAVLGRGCEVLVDKDVQLSRLPELLVQRGRTLPHLPQPEEFEAVVADFWYHVLWTAKKLRRGELWVAKLACDGYLKGLLVTMIEWRTTARHGASVDVWHTGRFLERWADPDVLGRLSATFGGYDPADLGRALDESGRLFSELAREVALATGCTYPDAAESTVRRLTAETLGRTEGQL